MFIANHHERNGHAEKKKEEKKRPNIKLYICSYFTM